MGTAAGRTTASTVPPAFPGMGRSFWESVWSESGIALALSKDWGYDSHLESRLGKRTLRLPESNAAPVPRAGDIVVLYPEGRDPDGANQELREVMEVTPGATGQAPEALLGVILHRGRWPVAFHLASEPPMLSAKAEDGDVVVLDERHMLVTRIPAPSGDHALLVERIRTLAESCARIGFTAPTGKPVPRFDVRAGRRPGTGRTWDLVDGNGAVLDTMRRGMFARHFPEVLDHLLIVAKVAFDMGRDDALLRTRKASAERAPAEEPAVLRM
jgi:hypothetical protein